MMMFAQRDVGFMRLRRKHLPKQRLANRMRTGSQGMGVAGRRAIHSSTIYRLGITANGQLEKGRFVAGHACGDAGRRLQENHRDECEWCQSCPGSVRMFEMSVHGQATHHVRCIEARESISTINHIEQAAEALLLGQILLPSLFQGPRGGFDV